MRKRLSEREIFERSISEEDVFGACRALLELNGAVVHRVVERIPWGRKKSEPGIPDMFGWFKHKRLDWKCVEVLCSGNAILDIGPVSFYVEIKKPGGKHRPAQVRWIEDARKDGVIAFFADSVEQMVEEFKKLGIVLKGI